MADGLSFSLWELLGILRDRYGEALLGILGKPGVWDVVNRALVDGPLAWTPARLELALHETEYYKTTPIEVRQWDALSVTDPATAREQGDKAARMVHDVALQLGIQMDGATAFTFAAKAAIGQWDANRTRYELLTGNTTVYTPGMSDTLNQGSEIAATAAQVRSIAEDYGVPMSDFDAIGWARKIAAGIETTDAVKGAMQQWAAELYPAIANNINAGMTVKQYATPFMNLAVNELGINPNDIKFTDPKWTNLFLNPSVDGKPQTVKNMNDVLRTIRTDPIYNYDSSANATKTAAQFATQLGQRFGAIG